MPWSSPRPLKRVLVTPAHGAPCLCGSGESYATCCQAHLPGHEQGKAFAAALRAQDLDAALIATRADFTQHAIWHATNTAPAMRAGVVGLGLLVDSDIRCMTDSPTGSPRRSTGGDGPQRFPSYSNVRGR